MKLGKDNHKNHQHRNGFITLDAQIKETEIQLTERQQAVQVHADTLVKDLQKELTSPATLLLVSEFGFIVGELTKRAPKPRYQRPAGRRVSDVEPYDAETPLKQAVNFKDMALSLYRALPLAWILDILYPAQTSKPESPGQVKLRESRKHPSI